MRVEVSLWGNLRRFSPGGVGSMALEVAEGATIQQVAREIGAEHDVFAASLNGRLAALSTPLSANDRVLLFDHFKGG